MILVECTNRLARMFFQEVSATAVFTPVVTDGQLVVEGSRSLFKMLYPFQFEEEVATKVSKATSMDIPRLVEVHLTVDPSHNLSPFASPQIHVTKHNIFKRIWYWLDLVKTSLSKSFVQQFLAISSRIV